MSALCADFPQFGPFVSKTQKKRKEKKKRSIKVLTLVGRERTDHTHLCNVVVFVRPLQKCVRESQSGDALEQRGRGKNRTLVRKNSTRWVFLQVWILPADPGRMRGVWGAERGRQRDSVSRAVAPIRHTSGSTGCYTSPAPGPWFVHYNTEDTNKLLVIQLFNHMLMIKRRVYTALSRYLNQNIPNCCSRNCYIEIVINATVKNAFTELFYTHRNWCVLSLFFTSSS